MLPSHDQASLPGEEKDTTETIVSIAASLSQASGAYKKEKVLESSREKMKHSPQQLSVLMPGEELTG